MKYLSILTITLSILTSCINAQDVIDSVDETFANINAIEVEGSFCQVNVIGNQRNNVHLKGEILSSRKYDIQIRHNVSGGTLRVWIVRPNMLRNVRGKIELNVPETVNVRVDNSSGSMLVRNIGEGNTRLKSSSGTIKAEDIHSSLHASSSSGNIHLTNIEGNAKTTSSSGSQKINSINGDLCAKASSGSIKIEQISGEANLTTSSGSQQAYGIGSHLFAQASSGSINLNDVTGNVNVQTSSGGIKLNKITGAVHAQSTSGGQKGTAIKLTGSSTFKASSGSVAMDLLNDANELSFALRASSGSLHAKGQSGKKQLTINNGPIKITGTTSSGSQSYR